MDQSPDPLVKLARLIDKLSHGQPVEQALARDTIQILQTITHEVEAAAAASGKPTSDG